MFLHGQQSLISSKLCNGLLWRGLAAGTGRLDLSLHSRMYLTFSGFHTDRMHDCLL